MLVLNLEEQLNPLAATAWLPAQVALWYEAIKCVFCVILGVSKHQYGCRILASPSDQVFLWDMIMSFVEEMKMFRSNPFMLTHAVYVISRHVTLPTYSPYDLILIIIQFSKSSSHRRGVSIL